MLKCVGCDDFGCAKDARLLDFKDDENDDVARWLLSHKLVFQEVFCGGHEERTPCVLHCDTWMCTKRACRHKAHLLLPLVNGYDRVASVKVVSILLLYSRGMSQVSMAKEVLVNKNTICKVIGKIEEVLAHFSIIRIAEIKADYGRKNLVVDETAFSTRKNHAGKRVRAHGAEWAETICVTKTEGGKIDELVLVPVRERSAPTLLHNIEEVASRRTIIRTDGWRGYNSVDAQYAHLVVVHKEGFVNAAGVHTNAAECCNALVKKELRSRGNQLGQRSEARANRIRALSQIVNAKLTKNGVFCEILKKIRTVCAVGSII